MATKERIFFAGVGTTFAILAMGFGGGFLMASSTLHDTSGLKRASVEQPTAIRVVHPTSAEPPLQVIAAAPVVEPRPATPPDVQPPPQVAKDEVQARAPDADKQVERIERRNAEAAEIKRRKQYAERKAKRELARFKQQQELQQREVRQREPGILAFGVDDERPRSDGFFGH